MECSTGVRSFSLLLLAGAASAAVISVRDPLPDGYVAAPYYPTPYGGWAEDWGESYAKAVKLVSQMTLAEKTNITAGTGQFMGIRATDNNTAFPAGITTGATWNKELMYQRGAAMGQEFRGKGANFYLGPSVGSLGRKPRGGRNWEGFGSDPVLQAIAGAETIKGVQDQGVIATIKHLIGNEQEMYRMYNPFQRAYSSNIDDRTMHELYLWPFAEGIRAGVGSVMTAYNDVNGSAASQNSYLINGLLKDELGFQGLVMTDWLSQLSGVGSALAGLDMSMPGDTIANAIPLTGYSHWMYELTRSVLNGSLPTDRLNDMATRVVAAWYHLGQDQGYPEEPNFSSNTADAVGPLYPGALFSPSGVVNRFVDVRGDHAAVAKQVAQEAITLLKNDGGLLPLRASVPLSVFGTDARADPQGINSCTDKSCNRGTLGMGWGSGSANYPYLDDPISALRRKVANVTYYETDSFPTGGGAPKPGADDVAVVFLSSDAGENTYTVEGDHGDRDGSGLSAWHGGDALVRGAAAAYASVVVVIHTVGPLVLEPWIDLPSVRAVLVAHLPGQEAGDSLAEVLLGEASPSGHLPYSIPRSEADDYPASAGLLSSPTLSQIQDTYTEGLYVDYRYLHKAGRTPRFAFGHGLGYTTFELANASVARVTEVGELPPARPPKPASPVAGLDAGLPPAEEAYEPDGGFDRIWRYLYSWLSKGDADKARAIGAAGEEKYPYPEGYSGDQREEGPPAGGPSGGNPALWDVAYAVSVTVTNAGAAGASRAGKAVAQAYVQFPQQQQGGKYDTPVIQLRDFAKTRELAPGESQTLELKLTRKDVSVWDVERQNWVVPSPGGRYKIWVGQASDDLGVVCYSDTLKCESGVEGPV